MAASPNDPELHYALAEIAAAPMPPDWARSEAELRRAIDLARGHPVLAADLRYRWGVHLLEREQPERAEQLLREAAPLAGSGPTGAAVEVALAAALQDQGHEAEALAHLRSVAKLAPRQADLARARQMLARLTSPSRGLGGAARAAYRDGLRTLSGGDPGRALAILDPAVERFPEASGLHTLLGLAHARLGNDGPAVAALLRAAELRPEVPQNHLRLAELYQARGLEPRAMTELRAAVEADPLQPLTWVLLGQTQQRAREFGAAVESLERAAVLDGGATPTLLWLGRALMAAERFDEAERVYLRVERADRTSYEANLQLAEIYRRRRLRARGAVESERFAARARHYLDRARELNPNDTEIDRLVRELDREQNE